MGAEDDYQVAAPTESRTPHWHRAKIAHTRVRKEGWRQRRLGCTEKMERPKRERYLLLTWTSLLMGGLGSTGAHAGRFDGVGSALYRYFSYLGFGRWKIKERTTSVREASRSVKLVKRCVMASCSSGERLSRSARKAARTLSIEAKSFVAIQV